MAEFKGLDFYGWVVTNTRFTPDALAFGECSGLKLMSWDYPQHHSLKDKIEQFRLFPVTVLTHLTKTEKQLLLSKNIVLCKQVIQNLSILDLFELTIAKRNKLIKELNDLCS